MGQDVGWDPAKSAILLDIVSPPRPFSFSPSCQHPRIKCIPVGIALAMPVSIYIERMILMCSFLAFLNLEAEEIWLVGRSLLTPCYRAYLSDLAFFSSVAVSGVSLQRQLA